VSECISSHRPPACASPCDLNSFCYIVAQHGLWFRVLESVVRGKFNYNVNEHVVTRFYVISHYAHKCYAYVINLKKKKSISKAPHLA